MINKYVAPIINADDAKLPLCVVTVGRYPQCKINRPYGIPHHQILLTTKGTGSLHLGRKKYILAAGDILITPPDTPQKYQPVSEWETMYITYISNLSNDFFAFPDDIFHASFPEKYEQLISKMLSLDASVDFCRKTSPVLYELLLELSSEITNGAIPGDRLAYVRSYIQGHYFEELDITTLSGLCGLVPEYFSRLYKKMYHMSPIEHVHKLRMQDAKRKLIFSEMPISQISKSVGYNSPSHFGKLFKNSENLTPNQFRAIYQQK